MTHANRRSLRVFTALTALLLTAAVILSLTGEETVRPAGAAAAIPVGHSLGYGSWSARGPAPRGQCRPGGAGPIRGVLFGELCRKSNLSDL